MLMKAPVSQPQASFADSGGLDVRLAAGVYCPHCLRPLRASDVRVADDEVRLICDGCHRDVLTITVPQ
jgi:hypothetical protein